jgi:hypothetical protein
MIIEKSINNVLREIELLENEILIKKNYIDKREKEKILLELAILEKELQVLYESSY